MITDYRRTFLSSGYVFCTKLYGWIHAGWSTFDYNDTCTLHVKVGGRNHRSCVQIYVNRDLTRERKPQRQALALTRGKKKWRLKGKRASTLFPIRCGEKERKREGEEVSRELTSGFSLTVMRGNMATTGSGR